MSNLNDASHAKVVTKEAGFIPLAHWRRSLGFSTNTKCRYCDSKNLFPLSMEDFIEFWWCKNCKQTFVLIRKYEDVIDKQGRI